MTHLKAPHIEPSINCFAAIVKTQDDNQEFYKVHATTPEGAADVVQYWLPNCFLMIMHRIDDMTDINGLNLYEDGTPPSLAGHEQAAKIVYINPKSNSKS